VEAREEEPEVVVEVDEVEMCLAGTCGVGKMGRL